MVGCVVNQVSRISSNYNSLSDLLVDRLCGSSVMSVGKGGFTVGSEYCMMMFCDPNSGVITTQFPNTGL